MAESSQERSGAQARIPTLVSFFGGGSYYYEAADRLRDACNRLSIPHDIEEIIKDEDEAWSEICRRKIPFYSKMLQKHPQGIFWADCDTILVKRPEIFDNASYDIAVFLRNFQDLKSFDPVQFARTFHPGFIHFNGTEKTRLFVEYMAKLERESLIKGTDDYFLEEAWRGFRQPLSVLVLAKDLITKNAETANANTCFIFGDSGNVTNFKSQVEQHSARVFDLRRQTRLLIHYAAQSVRNGRRDHAKIFLQKAHGVDKSDPKAALSLAKLLMKMGEPDSAVRTIKTTFKADFEDVEPRQILVDGALEAGDWRRALANVKKLEVLSSPAGLAFARSRRYLIDLERRAENLGLSPEARPELYWMDTPFPGNFGDVLNPYLVEKLSGIPPRRAKAGDGILAIGSVIKFARAGTIVWGTGTPRMTDILAPHADYRAVRGPLTRQLVEESGGNPPDVFGDAAMLLPMLYKPKIEKKYKLGLIRHYTHVDEPLRLDSGVKEISIMCVGDKEIENFIDELCQCERILSSSLHGLIVAHAYGIPTRWCDFSEAERTLPGDATKFQDHYAAWGIRCRPPLNLSGVEVITPEYAAECDEVMTKSFNAAALLRVAPFPVLPCITDGLEGYGGGTGRDLIAALE